MRRLTRLLTGSRAARQGQLQNSSRNGGLFGEKVRFFRHLLLEQLEPRRLPGVGDWYFEYVGGWAGSRTIQINPSPIDNGGFEPEPRVTMAGDGYFVVVYTDNVDPDHNGWYEPVPRARRYHANGNPRGGTFRLGGPEATEDGLDVAISLVSMRWPVHCCSCSLLDRDFSAQPCLRLASA